MKLSQRLSTAWSVLRSGNSPTIQAFLRGDEFTATGATLTSGSEQSTWIYAAVNALAGAGNSAEIVALDWSSGQIRVLASHEAGNVALPAGGALNAKVEPGMAFSIVSAAALLSSGVKASHPLPCEPVADVGAWLRKVVNGYYRYHAVPGNIDRLSVFGQRLRRLWWLILRRRSQRRRSWDRVIRLFKRWIPAPRVLHPYPVARFLATHPRWEPYA